jgi:hypothetical protein
MYKLKFGFYLNFGVLLAAISTNAWAENNASLEGIIAGTYQAASKSDVQNEASGTLFLLGSLDMGPGTWYLEVRGSITPRDNGVTRVYDSNALVGETLNSDGEGRIAVTQLFYKLPVGPGQFRAGLLDPTALLDGNDTANDEYTQFLADAFVNNPSIGFPSFVLGAAYEGDLTRHLDYKLFAGSDSGLEDDSDPTYSNVFSITGHRNGHRKGAFLSGELGWHANGYSVQGGLWYDTGKVGHLGYRQGTENPYGFYVLAGALVGPGRLEARAGLVNPDAQAAANALSLSYQLPIQLADRETILGVAVARTGDSDELAFQSKPIYQAEAYWRIDVIGPLHVSPDIQYIKHAGFEASRGGAWIGGVRVSVTF